MDEALKYSSLFNHPGFAFAGMRPAELEHVSHKVATSSAESCKVGNLHLAGNDFGFGEFSALSIGLRC